MTSSTFRSCPTNTNNLSPFSTNSTQCRRLNMGSDVLTGLPPTKTTNNSFYQSPKEVGTRKRPVNAIKSGNISYAKYSVPNFHNGLEMSFECVDNSSVFPKNIYNKQPFASKSPSLEGPRDSTYVYIHVPGVTEHSPFSSRFGYHRFPETYEYGTGEQSRGYVETPGCHSCANDTPKDMAPARFYTEYHLQNSPSQFRKMIGQTPNPKSHNTLIGL